MYQRKRYIVLTAVLCLGLTGDKIVKGQEIKNYRELANSTSGLVENGGAERDAASTESGMEEPGARQFLLDTLYHFGFVWAGRLFYVRNKNARIFDTSFSDWMDNITQAPEWDDGDSYVTNLVLHPLFGAEYYLFYRARGHSRWASALGSFIQSALFEYAVEGLVETPSLQDLIFTPLIGAPMGATLEGLSDWLIDRDSRIARAAGHIVNPMRIFFKDREFGVLNPLTGTFAFQGAFSVTQNKSRALQLSYSMFMEPPIPLGRLMGSFEVVDLEEELGGQFIFYSLRVDFPSHDNRFGFYLRYPYAGVNNVTVNGEEISDGFEFSNIMVGGKLLAFENDYLAISGGLEVVPPTAFKDNVDRLATVVKFRRDFPLYLTDATTVSPYISGGLSKGYLSLLGNLGIDLVFNAGNLEGDGFESRIKYGSALGADIAAPTNPSLFFEFNGYTFISSSNVERTDLFMTPGVRFGKRFSPAVGVQIPVAGSASDIANASVIIDFQARF